MTAWMLTVLQKQDSLQDGIAWPFSTDPQRETAVSYNDAGEPYRRVRRRADRAPYMPRWQAGEPVFIYHPESERVVAWLTLNGPAKWNSDEELFYTDSTVEVYAPEDGPTLADIGVAEAVQGGRQRLTPSQHGAAVKALRSSPRTSSARPWKRPRREPSRAGPRRRAQARESDAAVRLHAGRQHHARRTSASASARPR
jgi:hypothetical protein